MNFDESYYGKNNFEYCYACKNQLLFHENDIEKILEKYLYKKPNKQLIYIIYRLYPKIIEHIKFDYYTKYKRIIMDLHYPLIQNNNFYTYESLFYQDNLNSISYIDCIICKNLFCPLHTKLTLFFTRKCKCEKNIQVCSFCYNILNTEILCDILHNTNNTNINVLV